MTVGIVGAIMTVLLVLFLFTRSGALRIKTRRQPPGKEATTPGTFCGANEGALGIADAKPADSARPDHATGHSTHGHHHPST